MDLTSVMLPFQGDVIRHGDQSDAHAQAQGVAVGLMVYMAFSHDWLPFGS